MKSNTLNLITYGISDLEGNVYKKGCFDKSLKKKDDVELTHVSTGITGTFIKEYKPFNRYYWNVH